MNAVQLPHTRNCPCTEKITHSLRSCQIRWSVSLCISVSGEIKKPAAAEQLYIQGGSKNVCQERATYALLFLNCST